MVIRQLKQEEFEALIDILRSTYRKDPLEASYTVNMFIDSVDYDIKMQPERHRKVAVLQAVKTSYDRDDPCFELITNGTILSSLLEIFIYQEVMALSKTFN